MQLTLVSHYGAKPKGFAKAIRELQSMLALKLGANFTPYAIEQVHATMAGLEGVRIGGQIRNQNFQRLRNMERCINFAGLMNFLRNRAGGGLEVRVGGFEAARDYGFNSARQHPYARSFSVRDEIAVAMGWPWHAGEFTSSLDEWRRQLQTFGVLHKWHRREEDVDDDFFFVLGRVAPGTDASRCRALEQIIREHLARAPALEITVSQETLSFVAYEDAQLPLATSQAFRLADSSVTEETLAAVYTSTHCD